MDYLNFALKLSKLCVYFAQEELEQDAIHIEDFIYKIEALFCEKMFNN